MTAELYHGDCLSVMARMPVGCVDLVVADLPYGTTRNRWDSAIPLDKLWALYAHVCKPTSAIVLTASQPFTSTLVMSSPSLFKHEWIWIKNRGSNFANTIREPMKEHERVLVFSRGGWTYNKQMQARTGGGTDRVKYGFEQDAPERTDNYGSFDYKRTASLGAERV